MIQAASGRPQQSPGSFFDKQAQARVQGAISVTPGMRAMWYKSSS
jgi:hypothetical protein